MLYFNDIVSKLKLITNKKRDIEIAVLLNADSAKFAQWKKRNTIPIQELVSYAVENNIDMNYLLKDDIEPKVETKEQTEQNILNQDLIEAFNKLNNKKQQYFYHLIMAESFKEED